MKSKINLKLIMYIILIFPFIKPNYVIHITSLNNIYNVFQIIDFSIILVMFFKNKKISKELIIIFLMEATLIISTICNNGDIFDIVLNSIQVIAFSMIVEILMKKDIKLFFKAIVTILIILVVINYITILINPDGYLIGYLKKWLFGTKNNHFSIILPTIALSYIKFKYIDNKKSLVWLGVVIISILSLLFLQSATSIVAMVILLSYFIIKKILNDKVRININVFFNIYILVFIGVIVFQIQNSFSYIIEDVLNKDITFTGRTDIWNRSIEFISKQPLLGYGNETQDIRVWKFEKDSSIHCHNMILEILYQGGIVFFILFVVLLNIIVKKIKRIKNNWLYNFAAWIVVVYCIALFTEVYSLEVIMWVMMILSNLYLLDNTLKRKEIYYE